MKILVVSNLYPPHYIGGYELRCAVVVNALRARGHEVEVLTSNHGLTAPQQESSEPGVRRSLRINGFFGHPWHGIRELRSLERENNSELRNAVERFRPDVVHVWNLGGISKSLILTLQKLNVPTVYDISDHWIARSLIGDVTLRWWNQTDAPLRPRLLRAFWSLTGVRKEWDAEAPTNPLRHMVFPRIYFCSAALREITVKKGYDVGHGAVIHCPVDAERFSGPVKSTDAPVRKLLYVGRLSEDKGALTALKAMALVKGEFDGVLHLYGKGDADYEAQLKAFAKENHLPVEFRSGTAAEMPAIYRDYDALVFTSEWEEPFALTPLEGMASGLPVIGTTTGGSIELFRHGENGLTYEAGNPEGLAKQILALQGDDDKRVAMATVGQNEVREKYNEPKIVDQIEAYLKETVQTWKPVRLPAWNE